MIQLHRLEGFYWVARTGGYARAARAFPYPITQPAVHQQVKKLESDLGVELFERVAKDQMKLTSSGQRLFEFVGPFFEGLPGVLRAIESGDYVGSLKLAAAGTMLRHLLPSWLKRLQKSRPGIQVELMELPDRQLDSLRRGDVDLIVDFIPEVPADIAVMRVATLRPFLVFPSTHPAAKKKRVKVADFAAETFISYPAGSLPQTLQMRALAAHDVTPLSTVSAQTADTILGIVESGLGYSLVPSLEATGPKGRDLVARPLSSPKVEFPVYAAWRKSTPENPILDAALEAAPKP